MNIKEAIKQRRCRICQKQILVGGLVPSGWEQNSREIYSPEHVIINYGTEFAHAKCLRES